MRLEAIYDNGQLKFLSPVTFTHKRFRVTVEISEQAIKKLPAPEINYESLDNDAKELLARLDAIRNAPLPSDADQPPLSEKQMERYEAFKIREDR